jgi:8-oxo-dGTP diphosphatase
VSKPYLEPPQWYASLPTIYVSACMLLTDHDDRVLLVKPNYRSYWAIPGGIVDDGEPPHECARREVAEELGLDATLGELLVVDWAPPLGDRPRPMMNFIFDGGTIDNPARIQLQTEELDDARFWAWDEAATKLPAATSARIPAARTARKNRRTIYLPTEAGF